MVIDAHNRGESASLNAIRRIGPSLIFERLWRETGLQRSHTKVLSADRKFEFPVERAVFVTAAQPAVCLWLGPFLQLSGLRTTGSAGVDELDLHHLYRAMAWLGEELLGSRSGQDVCPHGASRT